MKKLSLLVFFFSLFSLFPSLALAAPSASLSVFPGSVLVIGDSTTLSWTIMGASTCTMSDSTGASDSSFMTSSGSKSVSPSRDTTYFLECWDSAGVSSGKQSVLVAIIPHVSVSVDPTTSNVTDGVPTTITWSSDGDYCSDWTGTSRFKSGQIEQYPRVTTTYTIRCSFNNSLRNNSASATITIIPPGTCGASSSVTWGANDECHASPSEPLASGTNTILSSQARDYSGNITVRCEGTTLQKLNAGTCVNTPGSGPRLCTGVTPWNISSYTEIYPGDTSDLTADTSWQFSDTDTGRKCEFHCMEGSSWVQKSSDGTYTCSSPGSGSSTDKPVVSLWSDKNTIKKGEAVTLSWSADKAGQCDLIGTDPNWNGVVDTLSGSRTLVPSMEAKYITNLDPSDPTGNLGLHNYYICTQGYPLVQIIVIDPPVIKSFTANPTPIDAGQSSTLTWDVSNAKMGCTVYRLPAIAKTKLLKDGGDLVSSGASGEVAVKPTKSTEYVIECPYTKGSFVDSKLGLSKVIKKLTVFVNGTPDPISLGTCAGKCQRLCLDPQTAPFTVQNNEKYCPDTVSVCCERPSNGGTDPETPGGNVAPPSTSLSCPTGSECKSGTFCSGGTTKVASCNNGLGSCCASRPLDGGRVSGSNNDAGLINITNPLSFNTVEGLLNSILGFLQGTIAILSLIMIVIGSIVYMTAAGDEKKLGTGKMIITASLVGLALVLAAPSFLKQIGDILGWGTTDSSAVSGAKTITEILQTALNFLLSVVGIIAIIMLVIGGLMYLLSAGDEERMQTGKKIVIYSLIGIAVALGALVLVTQVAMFFA